MKRFFVAALIYLIGTWNDKSLAIQDNDCYKPQNEGCFPTSKISALTACNVRIEVNMMHQYGKCTDLLKCAEDSRKWICSNFTNVVPCIYCLDERFMARWELSTARYSALHNNMCYGDGIRIWVLLANLICCLTMILIIALKRRMGNTLCNNIWSIYLLIYFISTICGELVLVSVINSFFSEV